LEELRRLITMKLQQVKAHGPVGGANRRRIGVHEQSNPNDARG
jgi:hypothetical protein